MHTKFGGCGLSGAGDIATFPIWPNFPFRQWTIVHGGQKIEPAQKIHAICNYPLTLSFPLGSGSPAFMQFIDLLGDTVDLFGWAHYKGGLDTRNNATGLQSVYTVFGGHEVMFHVSTMLPYSEENKQQVGERKMMMMMMIPKREREMVENMNDERKRTQ